jgi:CYTH domain-containing protein
MPTEHEYKFVLRKEIANDPKLAQLPTTTIRQGYLAASDSMDLRVRHAVHVNDTEFWTVTFKQKVTGRKIELEQKVDVRDGMDLWEISDPKIKKIRHYLGDPRQGPLWEIDLFYSSDLYFAMAEIELPEGAPPPEELPDLIQKYLILKVPLTDSRFFNKNLGNVESVTSLYEELLKNSQGATNG